jgi:hypothetical protein
MRTVEKGKSEKQCENEGKRTPPSLSHFPLKNYPQSWKIRRKKQLALSGFQYQKR